MQQYRDAIASIESAGSGDYKAIGPTHPKMGRALGRYQIMEANIGPWSEKALGRRVSTEEFLTNPAIQDAIFDNQFGGYVNRYGDPGKAAQAWLGGDGSVGKLNRKDSLGTSVGEYEQKFNAALGNPSSSSSGGSGGNAPAPRKLNVPGIVMALAYGKDKEEEPVEEETSTTGGIFSALQKLTPTQEAPQLTPMQSANQSSPALAQYVNQYIQSKKKQKGFV
ncbi:hypothetical protein [Phyllobacterium sophorae]|uniref:hypothetical protein n=1 Tax=Phyllobacterium sophorae TaxID=1520277 RepID=UPI001FE16069|nr:hypothetical protein [Phyllobacterium sophorae]